MLYACESFSLADIALTLRFGSERDVGLYHARIEGVSWDTSLLPGPPPKPDQWVFLCYVGQGSVTMEPSGEVIEAGSTFVASEYHIATWVPGGPTLRGSKPLLNGIALRLRREQTTLSCLRPRRADIAPSVERALARAFSVVADPGCHEAALVAQWRQLVDECLAAGVLTVRPNVRRANRERSTLARAQRALFPILENLVKNPMLVDVTARLGITDRQVRRDILRLQTEFDLLDRGWRSAVNRWRIIAAVLSLSSAALTNAQIASAVGYSRLTAMDRAFKRAGLPAPSVVRERHRGQVSHRPAGAGGKVDCAVRSRLG